MSRAIEEIQSEGQRLASVEIPAALESADWVVLARLAERLYELANRGVYHSAIANLAATSKLALGNHCEHDPR